MIAHVAVGAVTSLLAVGSVTAPHLGELTPPLNIRAEM